MKYTLTCICMIVILAAVPNAAVSAPPANIYIPHNLVSDLPGQAEHRDVHLANPWGIGYSPTGPFWIADNHNGVATVYDDQGRSLPEGSPLVVTIPTPVAGMPPTAPTGIVYNGTADFELGAGLPALFIFATEDGTISGWNPAVDQTHAIRKVDSSGAGAVYKGLALGNDGGANFLYVTNFNAGTVSVFDKHFAPAMPGTFLDATIPAGFAPFGIRNIGGKLFVTYAMQNAAKHDDVAGPGNGFVDVFSTSGVLLQRLISHGVLNSPWGLALAPPDFGDLSNTLLVGNFGDGTIHGFDPSSGAPVGEVSIPSGKPFVVQGLWGLTFGNGEAAGEKNVLFFTAGIPGPSGMVEDHGLFGSLKAQHPDDNGEGQGKGHQDKGDQGGGDQGNRGDD
jgi:uncharacterized protein (TIGR03118 family)